ncbi:MAG TPA: response regulator transcription factor [Elusimicrobiota bacterium]|nr:response regulator transcription factor [Elusimicrobiota bacterium]
MTNNALNDSVRQKRILVVEDDPEMRFLVDAILTRLGYAVKAFGTAEEGMEETHRTLFDLAILDINLPGMSGLTLCKILKTECLSHDLPILILTASADEGTKERACYWGVQDYVQKPPAPLDLVERIQRLLAGSGRPPAPLSTEMTPVPAQIF